MAGPPPQPISSGNSACLRHCRPILSTVGLKKSALPQAGRILIGTASWSDPGFVQHWYPKGMRAHERLGWYAQHFEMVEVNSTFYSVPDVRMVERWCAATPDGFTFDVKLHQLFSFHSTAAKLLPPDLQQRAETDGKGKVTPTPDLAKAMLDVFLRSMSVLRSAGKLGVLLLQLSPAFSPRMHKLEELEDLIGMLRDYRLAIEFRNRNWAIGDQLRLTIGFLKQRKVTFVNVDAPAADHFTIMPSDLNEITNPGFSYLRLHGRNARGYLSGKTVAARFDYNYSDQEIVEVVERSKKLARKTRELHVVFNNNNLDYAPRAAARLRAALGQLFSAPPQTPELF
jgi:uncharacterized protein YecE (DUF72 family)